MRKDSRAIWLDKVHVWSVRSLIGLTLFGGLTISLQVYNWFTNVRPQKMADRQKQKELDVAMEQEEREAELLRRQKDAETQMS